MNDTYNMMQDERITAAINELQRVISQRYPTTSYQIAGGDDPVGIYVTAVVDVDDTDEVVDLIIDQLLDIQIKQQLPIYVLPVPTPERVISQSLREQRAVGASAAVARAYD